MPNRKDLLAYLFVLNCPEVWNLLTLEEQEIGRENVMGCYCRLTDSLEDCGYRFESLKKSIEGREFLNTDIVYEAHLEAKLAFATRATSLMIFNYLRDKSIFPNQNQYWFSIKTQTSNTTNKGK